MEAFDLLKLQAKPFENLVHKGLNGFRLFLGKRMLNSQESGRLDAKRHYIILAKALDGIWPVGHGCVVLC